MAKTEKAGAVAVTTKGPTDLAKYGGLMDETPVDAKDFLIPKLLLMQSTSQAVKDEKARAGEIRGSIDMNKLAEKEGSLEIIPFSVYKTWVTLKKKGNEFVGQVPYTPQNALRPREEILNGEELVHYETLNYYCLLPTEIASGMFLPYVVSFRSTSYMAGKTLETHRARLQEFGKPLPFKTFKLGVQPKKNEHGSFHVFTIAESRDTTEEELEAVSNWHAIVKKGQAKVDESDLATEAKAAAPSGPRSATVEQGEQY